MPPTVHGEELRFRGPVRAAFDPFLHASLQLADQFGRLALVHILEPLPITQEGGQRSCVHALRGSRSILE